MQRGLQRVRNSATVSRDGGQAEGRILPDQTAQGGAAGSVRGCGLKQASDEFGPQFLLTLQRIAQQRVTMFD